MKSRSRVVKRRVHTTNKVRTLKLGRGVKQAIELSVELEDMRDVLLGHADVPEGIHPGPLALMEVAEAYFSRACDIEQIILKKEREGSITGDSSLSRFRKGELRSFKEMAKSAADLGSRRLTAESLRFEQERNGRESA